MSGVQQSDGMLGDGPPPARKPRRSRLRRYGLPALGVLACLAVVSPRAIARSYYIPSGAMAPTLRPGDRVLVNLLAYRLGSPERGDVIVFDAPPAALQDEGMHKDFIKRVVGVPGDTIQIRQGKGVFVNGKLFADVPGVPKPDCDWPTDEYGEPTSAPYRVPENCYFVLGDNRNESYDSHFWRDPKTQEPRPELPRSLIIGRVTFRFFPGDRMGAVL